MDRITLSGMRFEGRHGVSDEERALPQLLEVDLEVEADVSAAGRSDALADTVNYSPLIRIVQEHVERHSYRLLEAIAEAIAGAVLAAAPRAEGVVVRVRKLAVPVDADLDHAEVEIRRARPDGG
jgi:7,8-dihydroneopterin aldolase/epimerase/oxygenase